MRHSTAFHRFYADEKAEDAVFRSEPSPVPNRAILRMPASTTVARMTIMVFHGVLLSDVYLHANR